MSINKDLLGLDSQDTRKSSALGELVSSPN